MKKKTKSKATPLPAEGYGPAFVFRLLAIPVALLGVFWLPWHVPYSTPVPGESYALGYNNKAGILALAFAIALAAGACWAVHRKSACAWIEEAPRLFPPWREARFEYLLLAGFSLLMAGFILFWSGYLVDPAWCEARGFIYGMDLLAVGQVPYRDFMYNYGPATIYLPFWLSNLTHGALSFEQAYGIFVALFTVLGLLGIFVFFRVLVIPPRVRPWLLLLALGVWVAESMGLQYTPFRFFVVPMALIGFHQAVIRCKGAGARSLALIALAAIAAVFVCLAVSPEMGIAAALGVMAYAFVLLLARSFARAAVAFAGAILVFVIALIVFPGYLDSVLAFSAGGANFPLFPNLTNLSMVAIALIVLPPLLVSAIKHPGEGTAPLALALAVGGGMLLPVAFGRCDPGHVAINSEILLFLMFPAAAAAGRLAFRSWVAVYALIWVFLVQWSYWSQYIPNFQYAINAHESYRAHPEQVAAWKSKWDAARQTAPHGKDLHWSKVLPFPQGLDQLTAKGPTLLASGNEGTLSIARFLILQNPPPREYFQAYGQNASTPSQVTTKAAQDSAYEFIIIPSFAVSLVGHTINLNAYQQSTDAMLSRLLFFPVSSDAVNQPYFPDSDLAARLLPNYTAIAQFSGFVILRRNNPAP
jgi:hypothetical protein